MKQLAWALVLALAGCTKPSAPMPESPTFTSHIRAITKNRCASCHFGKTDWTDYAIVKQNKDKIFKRVVKDRTMPPTGMPENERQAIGVWITQGMRE